MGRLVYHKPSGSAVFSFSGVAEGFLCRLNTYIKYVELTLCVQTRYMGDFPKTNACTGKAVSSQRRMLPYFPLARCMYVCICSDCLTLHPPVPSPPRVSLPSASRVLSDRRGYILGAAAGGPLRLRGGPLRLRACARRCSLSFVLRFTILALHAYFCTWHAYLATF